MMKVLVALLIVPLISVVSVLVMIYGWGISPQNWPVIIGGYVALFFFQCVSEAIKA